VIEAREPSAMYLVLRPRWIQIGDHPYKYRVVYRAKICQVLRDRKATQKRPLV
jgi:hypothetical protein